MNAPESELTAQRVRALQALDERDRLGIEVSSRAFADDDCTIGVRLPDADGLTVTLDFIWAEGTKRLTLGMEAGLAGRESFGDEGHGTDALGRLLDLAEEADHAVPVPAQDILHKVVKSLEETGI